MTTTTPAILEYLGNASVEYAGKLATVADAAEKWLEYVPETFPHYTTHTIRHSEAILSALSRLLFVDGDAGEPVLALSDAETYVLACGAYLHDAGMVVSAAEQERIVQSGEFQTWIAPGGPGHARHERIAENRASTTDDYRLLRADRQLRFLIADFTRRSHHTRSAGLVLAMHEQFAQLDFGDNSLRQTIAAICAGHGLNRNALEDPFAYPDRRDLRGSQVNVRLMAILLRLGDLLDMRQDRACPLGMYAGSPLPSDSLPHWTKYAGIQHQLVAPDRIELRAECQTQDEHRFFYDWCRWLVDEVQYAAGSVPRMARHRTWVPPHASLDGPTPTITISPAAGAHYLPREWRFELDQQTIFERLVRDIYAGGFTFVRELIQNAADATRCRIYGMLGESDRGPTSPTSIDEKVRAQFPLRVSVRWVEIELEASGEVENRQELAVEDDGFGMDEEAITNYLLQVGKSFYQTPAFSRQYGFTPVSRFGIGFLSVFAESQHVVIETLKETANAEPIRMTLTGPRQYILTERGDRPLPGTRITVRLDKPLVPGQLTTFVRSWCRRLEFPVVVDDFGQLTTVEAEDPTAYLVTIPAVDNGEFSIRSFPVDRTGIEGELYVFAYTDERGESWSLRQWARGTYLETHPSGEIPVLPARLLAIGGISVSESSSEFSTASYRLDYRTGRDDLTLEREHLRFMRGVDIGPDRAVRDRWAEILSEHLASGRARFGDKPWRYRQRLASEFDFPAYWESVDGLIPVAGESPKDVSVLAFSEIEEFWVAKSPWRTEYQVELPDRDVIVDAATLSTLPRELSERVFSNASLIGVDGLGSWILTHWRREGEHASDKVEICSIAFGNMDRLAVYYDDVPSSGRLALNVSNPLGRWALSVFDADSPSEPATRLRKLLVDASQRWSSHPRLRQFVDEWKSNGMEPAPPDGVQIDEQTVAAYRNVSYPPRPGLDPLTSARFRSSDARSGPGARGQSADPATKARPEKRSSST